MKGESQLEKGGTGVGGAVAGGQSNVEKAQGQAPAAIGRSEDRWEARVEVHVREQLRCQPLGRGEGRYECHPSVITLRHLTHTPPPREWR